MARAFPVVVAGPSGAGKTSLCQRLLDRRDDLRFSVSATTRSIRSGEKEGVDYHFMDRQTFARLQAAGEFLEWAEVHDELYGTPRSNLTEARQAGQHLLLDVDVCGARSIRKLEREALTIFLFPPDGERILQRLRGRASEGEEAIRRRMTHARSELLAVGEFDYVLVNDDLDRAADGFEAILDGESHRVSRLGEVAERRARTLADEIQRTLT